MHSFISWIPYCAQRYDLMDFIMSEEIDGILNTYVVIFVWSYRISASNKTKHKVTDQVGTLYRKLTESLLNQKTIWTAGNVFTIVNKTLIYICDVSGYILQTDTYVKTCGSNVIIK